ncbi:MAG: protein kinase [Stigonema ocellatum SAG 48.90 = DSM 106950]|nr:protein kinase [Stigonema ocellatum SAG 48.90 = DSM 106950]
MLAEINPGTLINYRYQIQRVLGQGGFGRTYLATDSQRFGDFCVLKEFLPSNREEYFIQKSRELFEREARVLYQINHPQVPKFLAWFTEQERLFIVQEYIDGKTYSQLLQERLSQQNQSFSEAEISQWLRDLLSVLDYLHGIKILHRDISLDNVMLPDNQSKPVLIDFGLVKEKVSQIWCVNSQGSQNSSSGTVLGRVGYAPPEQIRMGQSYPSSDLYALGVCAIVLLTGKMPDELMDQSLEWQWQSYVDISDSLAQILNKMLAEKPKQRYQSAKEILFELQPPTLPSEPDVSQPLKKVQINIDYANKERQVAEIVESDDFKLLEEQAQKFRSPEIATESDLEAHRQEETIPSEVKIITLPTDPGVVVPEPQLKTETPVNLNPEFITHCRQELTRFIGPFASFLIEDIIAQSPEITPQQLIEALGAEIPNPQRAQEFKNCIKISPLPPTVIELPVSSQQGNSTPLTQGSTQSYRMRARLIHVQTNRQIELPSHLSVIHIGKPNKHFTPEVDVSTFQNSEIVSRIHADIYVEADGFSIEDKGSVNGTCINNFPLLPITRYPLKSGDYISLGMQNLVKFMFQLF